MNVAAFFVALNALSCVANSWKRIVFPSFAAKDYPCLFLIQNSF
jgi:hypothetical protein